MIHAAARNGHSRPVVLFLCSHNSARSQMAEAFLRRFAGDRFEVHSAGLEPSDIHPMTYTVMGEEGIDLAGQEAKSVTQYLGKVAAKYVIFVCDRAEKACQFNWPSGLTLVSWPFEDPTAGGGGQSEMYARFRRVRDQIKKRIREWLDELDDKA